MRQEDTQPYANGLPPVLLETNLGVRVWAPKAIPMNPEIRRIIAGASTAVWKLGANYSCEGGIEGTLRLQHRRLTWVRMQWANDLDDPEEIWLMYENPYNPSWGDVHVAQTLVYVLAKALFGSERDSEGYPLLLSTEDPAVVRRILLNAFRDQFGDLKHRRIVNFLASPAGSDTSLTGMG